MCYVMPSDNLLHKIKKSILYFPSVLEHRLKRTKLSDEERYKLKLLHEHGFVVLDNFISEEFLNRMRVQIQGRLDSGDFEFPLLAQNKIDAEKHHDLIKNQLFGLVKDLRGKGLLAEKNEFSTYEKFISEFNPSTITMKPKANDLEYFKLFLSEPVLRILTHYLDVIPKLRETYIRRNFPAPYKSMNHYWHRDLNNKYYLVKVFFFFTDCTVDTGPHEYIKSSHRDLRVNGKRYYSDDEIESVYPKMSEFPTKSVVKAGTVVIEDTRGLHRAHIPSKGYRDLGFSIFSGKTFFSKSSNIHFEINKKTESLLTNYQQRFLDT